MIVSWNWLSDYVLLDMSREELQRRLMLAGHYPEWAEEHGDDLAINLEITSNRPDCNGHIGVAREIGAIFERPIKIPAAQPETANSPVVNHAKLTIETPMCPRYMARVMHGVKVGPSPKWLVDRLEALGEKSVNNVVDVTNYVMFECGQPLHAFDLKKLKGKQVVVRAAKQGEVLHAINHKTYTLTPSMCVIADAERPVALAGVMGGAETEVSEQTTDLLIEAAVFTPLAVRDAARSLKLHSQSSYRFERGLDPECVDWASRRCCELIRQIAGGEIAAGLLDVGPAFAVPPRITLRFAQIKRILGIEIPVEKCVRILAALGLKEVRQTETEIEVIAPTWRADLTREIDLVEEVGRVHGYEHIPEDVPVPLAPSGRSPRERVLERLRRTATALGFDEAYTISAVEPKYEASCRPWNSHEPITTPDNKMIGDADAIRQSLAPSLLLARRHNEGVGNQVIELFETAKIYLAKDRGLPEERLMLGLCTGGDYYHLKGVVETFLAEINPALQLEARPITLPLVDPIHSAELWLDGEQIGWIGEVSKKAASLFELRNPASVGEVSIDALVKRAVLIPQAGELSKQPVSKRDLNFVVEEKVLWADLSATVRSVAGPHLESLDYRETYRHESLGAGKKSLLLTMLFRGKTHTLTSEEVAAATDKVVATVKEKLGGELRV